MAHPAVEVRREEEGVVGGVVDLGEGGCGDVLEDGAGGCNGV